MATNLLIGYPQISVDATTTTTSTSADTSNPIRNVTAGARVTYSQLAAVASTFWVKFDIGASTQKTIDFLYVARANLLKSQGSKRVLLDGSTDDSSYTNICGVSSTFQAITLYGPRSADALFTSGLGNSASGTLSATPTYRYWRFWAAGSGTCPSMYYPYSKVMFGAWFDFGRDPLKAKVTKRIRSRGDRHSFYVFEFMWAGISGTLATSAITNFLGKPETGVIIHAASYGDILHDHTVVHCLVSSYNIEPQTDDSFNVTITFEEMI